MSVLLVGDIHSAEFHEIPPTLDAVGQVVNVPDMSAAAELLANQQVAPELIVLAQSCPGQFTPTDVDRLRQLAPLARIFDLLGSWCEGEMRSGKPLPGVIRIYWHQWPARWDRELDRLRHGRCPSWGLPPTAVEEDRLLLEADEPFPVGQGLIAIFARLPSIAEYLATACQAAGYSTVSLQSSWKARVNGAVAALFDATNNLDDLSRLVKLLAPTPVIVLLDFPRIEQHTQSLAAGAAAVLSKPLLVDDLYWELERVACANAGTKDPCGLR